MSTESGTMSTTRATEIVTVSFGDLVASEPSAELLAKIGAAYGGNDTCSDEDSSLGILAISGVPNLPELRSHLLPRIKQLASLSPSELSKVECKDAGYQVGWSHGKEKVEGDKFDTGKGSFYFNPLVDDLERAILNRRAMMRIMHTHSNIDLAPSTGTGDGKSNQRIIQNDEPVNDDEFSNLARSNPAFFARNVWPDEALPELEDVAKEVANLVVSVGRLVARACDVYVEKLVRLICLFGNKFELSAQQQSHGSSRHCQTYVSLLSYNTCNFSVRHIPKGS